MLLPHPRQGVVAAGTARQRARVLGRARRARPRVTARSSSPTGSGAPSARAAATRWRWRGRADGERFETLLTIGKEEMATESLERPALVRTPEGRWRLYLSCATPGTKHWRVEMTEAAHPGEFDVPAAGRPYCPGDVKTGVKDPVIVHHRRSVAPVGARATRWPTRLQADQMTTEYATSADGLAWTWHGTALSGTPGAVGLQGHAGDGGRASTGTRSWPTTTAVPALRRITKSGPASRQVTDGDGAHPGRQRAARLLAVPRRRPAVPGHRAAARRRGTGSTTR